MTRTSRRSCLRFSPQCCWSRWPCASCLHLAPGLAVRSLQVHLQGQTFVQDRDSVNHPPGLHRTACFPGTWDFQRKNRESPGDTERQAESMPPPVVKSHFQMEVMAGESLLHHGWRPEHFLCNTTSVPPAASKGQEMFSPPELGPGPTQSAAGNWCLGLDAMGSWPSQEACPLTSCGKRQARVKTQLAQGCS